MLTFTCMFCVRVLNKVDGNLHAIVFSPNIFIATTSVAEYIIESQEVKGSYNSYVT